MSEAYTLAREVPASRLTTWRLGGPVARLFTALTPAGLGQVLERVAATPGWLLLGGGSNLLVCDAGIPAAVRLGGRYATCEVTGDTLLCGAAVPGGRAVRKAAAAGLSGLEAFVSLPGAVGGWAATNSGPAGAATLERVRWLMARPRAGGATVRISPDDLDWGYRRSGLRGDWIVEEVAFRLTPSHRRTVAAAQRRHSRLRAASQPRGASAGCVFRNPPDDHAGRLIDSAGMKGRSVGDVAVSRRHANFFLNGGRGTAAEAWRLIADVRQGVARRWGVALELEVEPVGAFGSG